MPFGGYFSPIPLFYMSNSFMYNVTREAVFPPYSPPSVAFTMLFFSAIDRGKLLFAKYTETSKCCRRVE